MSPPARRRIAVILAAGRGTRMRSALPKVLHPVAGRPLLSWVIEAARGAVCERIFVVVPPAGDGGEIRAALAAPDLTFVAQPSPRGTGHALLQAAEPVREALSSDAAGEPAEATLLVLSGDTPLLTADTLERLAASLEGSGTPTGETQTDPPPSPWGVLAVAVLEDPGALGRVLTHVDGSLDRIVEASDADADELAVRRINAGIYAFSAPGIFRDLTELAASNPDNAQGEIYLTDAPGRAAARGERVRLFELEDADEGLGVNTRAELARAHRRLMDRHLERLMAAGVTVLEPARTVIEPGVEVGRDTVIHPGVALLGRTRVGSGAVVHQGAWLRDAVLEDGATVKPYTVLNGTTVADGNTVDGTTVADGNTVVDGRGS